MGRTSSGSYRQIRVGRTVVGVVGLEEIFAALLKEGAQPSEEVMPELLARVRRYNYIAPAAEDEYTEALCHQLIDGFIEKGECDGAVDYAQQIPPRVIAQSEIFLIISAVPSEISANEPFPLRRASSIRASSLRTPIIRSDARIRVRSSANQELPGAWPAIPRPTDPP